MGLIIGGAVGNLIDRVRFGSVVDFIQVDFIAVSYTHLDVYKRQRQR